jgi:hypothetical protein
MKRLCSEVAGQSLVEAVALAPVVVLCGLLGMQGMAAGANWIYADNAAHSGALAAELGEDARSAARDALPGWAAGSLHVMRGSRSVEVDLSPRTIVPGLNKLLRVHAVAPYVGATGG